MANEDIILYTKNNCVDCSKSKALLHKLDIPYHEINVEAHPEALDFLRNEGYQSAPVLITADDAWSGFNETKIRSLVQATDSDWDY